MQGNNVPNRRYAWRVAGFSLVEMLVVVALIGIIAAVAYPSYTQFVTRSNRTVAHSLMTQIADRQEQFFLDNKRYAAGLGELGYAAAAISVNSDSAPVDPADPDRIYTLQLVNTSATTFTVNAAPALSQAARDETCQTLTLTHRGQKGHTGPGSDCW